MTDHTDELAGLPEDVREAFHVFERYECDYPDTSRLDLVLRNYCSRLARENAELKTTSAQIERENIEGWKQAARWKVIAERAEAELAALKRRIAEASGGIVTQLVKHLGSHGPDAATIEAYPAAFDLEIGQRVALLPVGGEG